MQPADYLPGGAAGIVMRYKTWIERFNRDPGLLNKTFELNGVARTLIGIMPRASLVWGKTSGFPKLRVGEVATGYAGMPARWFLLGRLKPGGLEGASRADATVIANHLAKIRPQDYPAHFQMSVKATGDTA